MAPMSLPPGFRFHPTDEELVAYYLDRKITGRTIELEIIPEVDLYKCEPWDLPEKSFIPSNDLEWYFYSPRDKKYPNGSRTNRATRAGYWKATGKDRPVSSNKKAVGMKKTLVYYRGRAPHGIRTNWVMHEYRLMDSLCGTASSTLKDSYALCRVFKKTVQPPKTKEGKNNVSRGDHDQTNTTEFDGRDLLHDNNNDENHNHYGKFPMSETTSSSDVTQGTPIGSSSNTPINVDDNLQQPPFGCNSDEANSEAHLYSSGLDFSSPLIQDLGMSSYTSWNNQLQYPPLAMEDFPQINMTDMNTLISKPEHQEYMMMYSDSNKYKDPLTGTLEEIFLLCSSQDNKSTSNDLINMPDH